MSLSTFNDRKRNSSRNSRDDIQSTNGPRRKGSGSKDDRELNSIVEELKSTSRSYAAQLQLLWNQILLNATELGRARDSANSRALEEAYDEIRKLTLEAFAQVKDFTDTFFGYLASNDSSSTKSEEVKNLIEHARRRQDVADQVVDNFVAALRNAAPKPLPKLWPMDDLETERLLRHKQDVEQILKSSSFPGGLLRAYFLMLPERRHQIYKFVERDHVVIIPETPVEPYSLESGMPLKLFLNVWRMFVQDIEVIDSAARTRDGISQVDPALGDKVNKLMRLYTCLPGALNEFSNMLSKLDFKRVSLSPSEKRRGLSFWSLWSLLLQILGIRPTTNKVTL